MEQISVKHGLAILGILVSGLIFLLYALWNKESKPSINGFLLSNRNLSGQAFVNTYAVTNVSLASNIIFFIAAHQLYGWLMGMALIVYTFVQYLMLHVVHHMGIDFKQIRTVADLWYYMFPSPIIARLMAGLTVFTCLLAVFIELYVGSVILSVFLPSAPIYEAGAFLLLGALVVGYVYWGGYRAIIKTDKWQLYLLILATIAIVGFSIGAPIIEPTQSIMGVLQGLFQFQAAGWPLFTFIVWVCILNVSLCFMDIAVWQRMHAAVSPKVAAQGLLRGAWKVFTIFWLPMLSFVCLAAKGYEFTTMPDYLDIVYRNSGWLGYITFPLIVVGFAAALFSTADTIMIAAIYGLCDRQTFLPLLERYPAEERSVLIRKYLSIFALLFMVFLSFFYYLQSQEIAQYIMPILEASWGIMVCLSPLPIYTFYRLKQGLPPLRVTEGNTRVLLITIILGSLVVLVGVFQEIKTGYLAYTQLSQLIAMLMMFVGLAITVRWPVIAKSRLILKGC